MPFEEVLEDDDDYVASLLRKDANSALKSGYGAEDSSTGGKRPKNTAKPNTRFLQNILRQTDNHNAALKAKEEEISRARLRKLGRSGKRERDNGGEDHSSTKEPQDGQGFGRWTKALSGLGGKRGKRKREEENEDGKNEEFGRKHRRETQNESCLGVNGSGKRPQSRRNTHDQSGRGNRSTSPPDEVEKQHRSSRNPEKKSRREKRKKSGTSPHHKEQKRRRRGFDSPSRPHSPSRKSTLPSNDASQKSQHDADSDSLDDLLGPQPPPKILPRGRGAFKSSAAEMDKRFDPTYDPKTDFRSEHNQDTSTDDWSMALAAVRDRKKWRAAGTERSGIASLTDKEVKTGHADNENDVDNVQWKKQGEEREWDRGKVMGNDDAVKTNEK